MSRLTAARLLWWKAWRAFDGLAADTLWSGAHDALVLVTAMTSFYLVTHTYPAAAYGGYVGLYGLLGAIGAFSYSGIGLAALQRLVGERDDPDQTLRHFLSLTILASAVTAALSITLSLVFLDLAAAAVVLIVIAELVGTATIFLSSTLVQAASGFAAATRVRVVVGVLRLGSVVGLHLTGHLTFVNLGLSYLGCFFVYALYLLRVHLPRHGYRVSFGRPDRVSLRASGMFSIPMGAAKIQTDADKFLLNVFGFSAQAGVYGSAYRLVQLGIMPLLALEAAAFQRFLPRSEGVPGLHWRRATRLAGLTFGASVVVAIALYFAMPYLRFLVDDGYEEAFDIVPWLLPLVPVIATSGTSLNGLLGLGQADKRMVVFLSSAVVSMVLYLILIPLYDWRGAVIATFVSEIYLAVAGWSSLWYYQRKSDADFARRSAPVPSTV